MRQVIEGLWNLVRRRFCKHEMWTPAITSKGGARFCYDCTLTEQLSDEDFYAQFGRIPKIGAC